MTETITFYNACVIGRRLELIYDWWQTKGKECRNFPQWVHKNFVGSALGKLTDKEIRSCVTLGKLQSLYPRIIFISSISWKELVKYPGLVHQFMNANPERRLFWTAANVKMQVKLPNVKETLPGPHLNFEGSDRPVDFQMELESHWQEVCLLEDTRREEEKMILDKYDQEQKKLGYNCGDSSSD